MPAKLDLFVVVAMLAGGAVLLEAGHRTDLVVPAVTEPMPEPDPLCVAAARRYLANRLVFVSSGVAAGLTARQPIADRVAPPADCQR
jgi:hypothetical protein